MNGDECGRSIVERERLPADLGDRDHPPEQAARCGRTERYDRLGLHDGALSVEPPFAAIDFVGIRALVQAALAAHLMLEVFDRIGDEHILAHDAGTFQSLVQETTRRANKWVPGQIFLVARLLADHHQTRMRPAFAGYNLRGELVERAARTSRLLS